MAREYLRVLDGLKVKEVSILGRRQQRTELLAGEFSNVRPATGDPLKVVKNLLPTHVIAAVSLESQIDVYETLLPLSDSLNLLLEKPLAFGEKQGRSLDALASDPLRCFVAMNRRFYSSVNAVKHLLEIDAATDGTPEPPERTLRVTDQENLATFNAIHPSLEHRGSLVFANSIHLIDLVRWFTRGKLNSAQKGDIVEFHIQQAMLQFDSGDLCEYTLFWNRPAPWTVEISTGTLFCQLSPLENGRYRRLGESTWTEIPLTQNDRDYKPGLFTQTQVFLGLSKTGLENLCTLDESLKTLLIAEEIAKICAPA